MLNSDTDIKHAMFEFIVAPKLIFVPIGALRCDKSIRNGAPAAYAEFRNLC